MKIGFAGLLGLMFILLKLLGHITWSWLWVLSPLWAVPAIVAALIVGAFVVTATDDWLTKRRRFKRMMRR